MNLSESQQCQRHPANALIAVCLQADCANSFLCLECLKRHDKDHMGQLNSNMDIQLDNQFFNKFEARREEIVGTFEELFTDQENELQEIKAQLTDTFEQIGTGLERKKERFWRLSRPTLSAEKERYLRRQNRQISHLHQLLLPRKLTSRRKRMF